MPQARFYRRLPLSVVEQVDDAGALRVVSVDDAGAAGALTLLPTTSFDLLDGAAPELLPEGRRIASPRIWEARGLLLRPGAGVAGIGRALTEIALAVNDIGRALGLTHVVAVYDAATHRWAGRLWHAGAPLGPAQRLHGYELLAAVYELGGAFDAHVRAAAAAAGVRFDPPTLRPDALRGWTTFTQARRS